MVQKLFLARFPTLIYRVAALVYIPAAMHEGCFAPHPHHHSFFFFFMVAILWDKTNLGVVWMCTFLAGRMWDIFMYALDSCASSDNCLLNSLAHLLTRGLGFWL